MHGLRQVVTLHTVINIIRPSVVALPVCGVQHHRTVTATSSSHPHFHEVAGPHVSVEHLYARPQAISEPSDRLVSYDNELPVNHDAPAPRNITFKRWSIDTYNLHPNIIQALKTSDDPIDRVVVPSPCPTGIFESTPHALKVRFSVGWWVVGQGIRYEWRIKCYKIRARVLCT